MIVTSLRTASGSDTASLIRELLELTLSNVALRPAGLGEIVDLLRNRFVTERELDSYRTSIVGIWDSLYPLIHEFQAVGARKGWYSDVEYLNYRSVARVLLDLAGYLSGDDWSERLQSALRLNDPLLAMSGAVSLIRHRQPVGPDPIERAAANHETRIILWEQLREMGMEWLMPEQWAKPEHLAASALVRWAGHPSELGSPPENVELMASFPAGPEHPSQDVYLFRFREFPKRWEAGEGWVAGIAGPFDRGEEIDSPWSAFERWDSMSPAEHFEKLYYRTRSCDRGN